jgi:hypothetical protein
MYIYTYTLYLYGDLVIRPSEKERKRVRGKGGINECERRTNEAYRYCPPCD